MIRSQINIDIYKIKIDIKKTNIPSNEILENNLVSEFIHCSSYCCSQLITKKSDNGGFVMKNKEQFKITTSNEGNIIVESECLDFGVICCTYLNMRNINYSIELNLNIRFNEKAEDLVEIYSKQSPNIAINEIMFDKRNKNRILINLTNFDFIFSDDILSTKNITSELVASGLERFEALYLCNKISKVGQTSNNYIELQKDQIEKVIFKENALYAIENYFEYFNEKFRIDNSQDLLDFLEEINS
ncbi:hypothetical protein [Aliarcobacter butzleri]|uniref:hypothetical protein n=1 Tax=Aliarcobacter butzleri TaxID=28197 RepID=UPI0021B1A9AA|nr:hypothetical protein [Aliarcobacter butzleri]MCT7602423.1 hypothetical protein [Aliarcobacter butzleri]